MAAPSRNTCGLMERSVRERVPPLLTDLYQFTMAYAYWRAGRHQEPAVFELFFRDNPFGGGFSLFAGLHDCLLFLRSFRFSDEAMLFLRTAALGSRVLTALRSLPVGYTASRSTATYIQGQSPEPRIREYFYYIDHQGQLFLDDTKVKNFVTCFKDKQFLVFFFSRLRFNQSGRYEEDFPFLSLCGRERNFLRCDDRPVVFTHLLQNPAGPQGIMGEQELLSYCGGAEKLSVPFRPEALFMHPISGRVYHPCSERSGGVGLVRSALAIELSPFFVYEHESGQSGQPTHFLWRGQKHTLTNELAGCLPTAEEGSGQHGELG